MKDLTLSFRLEIRVGPQILTHQIPVRTDYSISSDVVEITDQKILEYIDEGIDCFKLSRERLMFEVKKKLKL